MKQQLENVFYVNQRDFDLKVGERVVIKTGNYIYSGSRHIPEFSISKVTAVNKLNVELVDDKFGPILAYKAGFEPRAVDGQRQVGLPIQQINRLKTENHETILKYINRTLSDRNSKAVAFYVTSVNVENIKGRLIGHSFSYIDEHNTDQKILTPIDDGDVSDDLFSVIDAADVSREMPVNLRDSDNKLVPSLVVGDLAIVRDFEFEMNKGELNARLTDVAILDKFGSIEPAIDYLGFGEKRNFTSYGLVSGYEMEHEHSIAVSKTKPDTACVLVFKDVHGNEHTHILGSSGYHAYINEDLGMYLEDTAPGVGLWVMDNLRNHSWQSYEGEWDASVEGDWRAATLLDAVDYYGSTESLEREICEVMEIDYQPGIAKRYVALAEVNLFEEKFEQRHKEAVCKRFGIVDDNMFRVKNLAAPEVLENFLEEEFRCIKNAPLRDQVIQIFRGDIMTRSSQFSGRTQTDADKENNADRPFWFHPTPDLKEDIELIRKAIEKDEERLSKTACAGTTYPQYSLDNFVKNIKHFELTPLGLTKISDARITGGEWYAIENDGKIKKLALFVSDKHIATLQLRGEESRLETPFGLKITSKYGSRPHNYGRPNVMDIALDADRVFCELQARVVSGNSIYTPVEDGVYRSTYGVAYIEDGVLHRTDGPANIYGLDDGSVDWPSEYRFRGNLVLPEHREINEDYFAALDASKEPLPGEVVQSNNDTNLNHRTI